VNSENVIKNLRILWRTDRIIADIRMRHLLIGMGMRALAALIAAFGLLMLELAAYFALVQIWSAILAAAILGGINFVIAAILFVIAMRSPTSRELDFATEIHGSAIDALQADVRGLQSQASNLIHHPLTPSAERSSPATGAISHNHYPELDQIERWKGLRIISHDGA
jgi:hypothetical protein